MPGSQLAAGAEKYLGWGDLDSSEWTLELNLKPDVVDAVLDLLAERSPRLSEIVTAARDPRSTEAEKRRAALKDLEDDEDEDEYDEEEEDEYDDDPDAPWNDSPVSRLPKAITPGKIPIQIWRWYEGLRKPVGFDFIFTWGGKREVEWSYGISPDNPDKPDLWGKSIAPFRGKATWANGADVQLTYSSPYRSLSGEATLDGAAPTLMDPRSDERMSRPMVWVDFANKIISFIDDLPDG